VAVCFHLGSLAAVGSPEMAAVVCAAAGDGDVAAHAGPRSSSRSNSRDGAHLRRHRHHYPPADADRSVAVAVAVGEVGREGDGTATPPLAPAEEAAHRFVVLLQFYLPSPLAPPPSRRAKVSAVI